MYALTVQLYLVLSTVKMVLHRQVAGGGVGAGVAGVCVCMAGLGVRGVASRIVLPTA